MGRPKVKILKFNKNLFYVVVAWSKKSVTAPFFEKIGICFFKKTNKIIMLSVKRLIYWLNKGVKMNNFISYLFSIIFFYNIKNKRILLDNQSIKKNFKIKNTYFKFK